MKHPDDRFFEQHAEVSPDAAPSDPQKWREEWVESQWVEAERQLLAEMAKVRALERALNAACAEAGLMSKSLASLNGELARARGETRRLWCFVSLLSGLCLLLLVALGFF